MKKLNLCILVLALVMMNVLFSDVRHLIVMPEGFTEQAEELADYFEEEYGIERELHEIGAIIEGTDDPAEALHDYLETYFSQPEVDMTGSSVLLLGSGTQDWWNGSERNLIPVFLVNNFISDAGFVNFDGISGAEVAIGRIPAVNDEELTTYLDNYYSYLEGENAGLWQRKLLITADDEIRNNQIEGAEPNSQMNHSVRGDYLANSITSNYISQKVYGIDFEADINGEKPEARQAIIESLNNGMNLWCYTGQGSMYTLGDEDYFRLEDIALLTNESQRGFMFTATCYTGNFGQGYECMGEALLFNESGGIIGGILPSAVTTASSNNLFGCNLLPLLYDEGMSWGEALMVSQVESGASIMNSLKYNLLGDPLGKINSGICGALSLDPEVSVIIPGEETLLGWNCGTGYQEVLFGVQEASHYIEYTNTLEGITYNYSGYRPGEIVYIEVADVIDDRAEIEAILPLEAETGDDGRILCNTQNITGNTEFWFSSEIQIGESGNSGDEIPSKNKLSNYPNPFNPTTTIRYYLPEGGNCELSIYNIKGGLVKKLVNGSESEGWHEHLWDGRDQSGRSTSSGIYIIKLASEDQSLSRKISLIK